MRASSRVVYGRTFRVTSVRLWWLQRLSALALGPLLAVHLWAPHLARNSILNALLLAIVVGHGYSGITRLLRAERSSGMIAVTAWGWLIAITVFGLLIILFADWQAAR